MIQIRRSMLCLIFGCALLGGGCASSPVQRGEGGGPVAGEWLLHVRSNDVGYVQVPMNLEVNGTSFEGHSHQGAASDILGWWDLLLAKLFTDYFEHGALLHMTDGRIIPGDTTRIEGILQSALGPMRFSGTVSDGTMSLLLTRGGQVYGDIQGAKKKSVTPLNDYTALIDSALGVTSRHIYNRRLAATGEWRSFSGDIRELAGNAQDDLDMIFGFYHYAEDLPFSHFHLFRKAPEPAPWQIADTNPRMVLKTLSSTTGYLKVNSFAGTAGEIDSVFSRIKQANPPYLIIDLRGNPGGNVSAMKVLSHLADTALYGGVLLTNKWFEHASAPPPVEQYGQFPLLTEANLGLLREGMHKHEGIGLKVIPEKERYTGKVFVLVDGSTASSCEPVVYGIRYYGLGTVVGTTTAGAMLSGEEFPVGGDWVITIPTAEYYTVDGFRIDQVGVQPDISLKPDEDALQYVLNNLIN